MNQFAPLTDRFDRRHTYLRVSVTDRCNLRCVYCMPANGLAWTPKPHLLTFDEIERLCRLFAGNGVDKIRLTGGEPTVRPKLVELIARLASLPGIQSLYMTTNGLDLYRMAKTYREAGLSGVNISLDSLNEDKYAKIARRHGLARAREGIEAALQAGFESVKVNVVVMKGVNETEIPDFVEFARVRPIQIRFLEFMPFDDNGWSEAELFPYAAMLDLIRAHHELVPIDSGPNAVAKEFALVGGLGTIGFVTSMTENFCGGCNRLRLTADGKMKNCLFSPTESDLRDHMRGGASDEALLQIIRGNLWEKWAGHPGMNLLPQLQNRSMIQIGG